MKRILRVIYILSCLIWMSGCFVSSESLQRKSDGQANCECQSPKFTVETRTEGTPKKGGMVDIRISAEPATLLPLVEEDPLVHHLMLGTVLERLIRFDDNDSDPIPELASRYNVDEARGRYEFYLQESATWHDGYPVTAQDVHFVFSKLMDPYSGSSASSIFSNIKTIETPDESTVIFELDQYMPDFMAAVSTVPILPAHIFGHTPLALHPAARAPIGSGPFRFVRWVPSHLIELERYTGWWGYGQKPNDGPFVDQMRYQIVPDNRIALDMFNSGDLDMVLDLPEGIDSVKGEGRDVIYPQPYIETLVYNFSHPIFAETTARHALAMLIDKQAMRCAILKCLADLPGEIKSGRLLPVSTYQPEKALKMLKESGWADHDKDGILDRGEMPFSFSLLLPNLGRDLERFAIAVQSDLAEIGIDMRISTVSRGAFNGRLANARFDVAMVNMPLGIEFDLWSLLHTQKSTIGNDGAFSMKRVDAILDRLSIEPFPEERRILERDLKRILTRKQPMTAIFRPYGVAVVNTKVHGVRFENGWFNPQLLYLEETP